MDSGTWIQVLTIGIPALIALLSGGGLVAWLNARAARPKTDAEAKQILIASNISVADAWQNYALNVEKRFNDLEKKYDAAIAVKDKEIERLTKEVIRLRTILSKYQNIEGKAALDVPVDDIASPSPINTG